MKINEKVLSIPPYISTNWSNICALYTKGNLLVINLIDGETIHIPNLTQESIDLVFKTHAGFLESLQEEGPENQENAQEKSLSGGAKIASIVIPSMGRQEAVIEAPFRFGFGTLDNIGAAMQHN